jgi:hypothetical protein
MVRRGDRRSRAVATFKPFQAIAFLDLHLAKNGRFDQSAISGRNRRRLSRWLRNGRG